MNRHNPDTRRNRFLTYKNWVFLLVVNVGTPSSIVAELQWFNIMATQPTPQE